MLQLYDNALSRPNVPIAGGNPPVVALIAPAVGFSFPQIAATTGPTVLLSASASADVGRNISKVQFRRVIAGTPTVVAEATQLSLTNLALTSVATASSTLSAVYPPSAATNGDRKGQNWAQSGALNSGWVSDAIDPSPTLTIPYPAVRLIDEVDVFSVQDNYLAPITPTLSTVFTLYGLIDFEVEYHSGNSWLTVPGGSVRGNLFVWRQFKFAQPISTDAIRIRVLRTPDAYTRIAEFETWSYSYSTTYDAAELNVPLGAQVYDAVAIDSTSASTTSSSHAGTVTPYSPGTGGGPVPGTLRASYSEAALAAGVYADSAFEYFPMVPASILSQFENIDADNLAYKIQESREFPEYPGVKFIRLTSDGFDHSSSVPPYVGLPPFPAQTIASWRHWLPAPTDDVWLSYVIGFTFDVKTGFTETGMKLPGLGSDFDNRHGFSEHFFGDTSDGARGGFNVRTRSLPPNFSNSPVDYQGGSYEFVLGGNGQTDPGYGNIAQPWSASFKEGFLHTVDLRIKVNTAVDPANPLNDSANAALWNADGVREVWLDDVRVRYDTNVRWRYISTALIKMLDFVIYHGGQGFPRSPITFWVGPAMLSKVRAGKLLVNTVIAPVPPTPSPNNTHAVTIVENDLTVWTRGTANTAGTDFQALRNGVWVGGTYGSQYLYYGSQVYIKNTGNGNWYRWTGSAFVSIGNVDPSIGPPPTPPAGALVGLPSTPTGSHIAAIAALGNNQWVNLGPAAPDPVYGSRETASWYSRMADAPDLGGAFVSGQGPHGKIRADGRTDAVWFYDLLKHRWICLIPGIQTLTFKADIAAGRITIGSTPGSVPNVLKYTVDDSPVYSMGFHTYQGVLYDKDARVYHFNGWNDGVGGDQFVNDPPQIGGNTWYVDGKALLLSLGLPAGTGSNNGYTYDVATGRVAHVQSSNMFYFPIGSPKPGEWVFWADVTYSAWGVGATGTPPVFDRDFGACIDLVRSRIYTGFGAGVALSGGHVYIYDNATNAWSHPADGSGTPMRLPGVDQGVINMDTQNDRVVIFSGYKNYPDAPGIAIWNPVTHDFVETLSFPVGFPLGPTQAQGFYSAALNAHLLYIGVDGTIGNWWAYRYKV